MLVLMGAEGSPRFPEIAALIRADVFERARLKISEPSSQALGLLVEFLQIAEEEGVDVRAFSAQFLKLNLRAAQELLPKEDVDEIVLELLALDEPIAA
jgi:hypothetical protein